jgi:hypothetical protein
MPNRRFIAVPFTYYTDDKQVAERWNTIYRDDRNKTYSIRTFMLKDEIENIDDGDTVYVIGHANLKDIQGSIINEAGSEEMKPHCLAYRLSVMLGERGHDKRFKLKIYSCYSSGEETHYNVQTSSFAHKVCEKLASRGYTAFTGYGYIAELEDPSRRHVNPQMGSVHLKEIPGVTERQTHKWALVDHRFTRRAKPLRRIVWPIESIGWD